MKALRNGYGYSAINIAVLFLEGQGRPVDIERAVEFWKIAALFGAHRAMQSLAYHYYSRRQKSIAIQWYAFAIHHNSMDHHLRGLFSEASIPPDFDADVFEDALDDELLNNVRTKEFVSIKDYECDWEGIERRRKDRKKRLVKETDLDFPAYRKKLITDHRTMWNKHKGIKLEDREAKALSKKGNLSSAMTPNLIGLKPITFKDMDKLVEDKIYDGFALKVTVIEEVVVMKAVIALVDDGEGKFS